MAGRKQTPVHSLFSIKENQTYKGKRALCRLCFTEVANNGSRKEQHILNCKKCSDDIKMKYLGNQKESKSTAKSRKRKQSKEMHMLTKQKRKSINKSSVDTVPIADISDCVQIVQCEDSKGYEDEIQQCRSDNEKDESCELTYATSCEAGASATTGHLNVLEKIVNDTPRKGSFAPIFSHGFESGCSGQSRKKIFGVKTPELIPMTSTPFKLQPEVEFSSKKKKGQTQLPLCVDRMSPFQNEIINIHLARAIYASGCPLSLVENTYWRKAFEVLRPSYKLPSRFHLTNKYLEEEYETIKRKCQENLKLTTSVAILCDGWTNIRNEAIINFVISTPKPIFWKSLPSGSKSHTAKYMCEEISKVIEEIGSRKVIALCTDNASNMKKAWDLLQEKYPALECYGCLAHGLNLIFADCLKIATIDQIITECTTMIKMIKHSHLLLAKFKEKQGEKRTSTTLKLPVKTRWGSYVECLNSLLSNKQPLRSLAIDDDPLVTKVLIKPRATKLLNEVFWEKVEGLQRLFLPIAKTIKTVEGDEPHLSSVIKLLNRILEEVENTSIVSPLFKKEEADFVDIVKKRRSFCISNIHLAANLLDPRYRGKDLSPTENVQAFQKVYDLSKEMLDVDENKVMAELANFSSQRDFFSLEYLWASLSSNVSSTAWWIGLCKHCEISKVASRILDLPATSAACERSFSAQANIHSKKRNRLTNEHAEKLLFVSHNLKLTEMEQLEFSGNCSQINGLTSNQIHHTETTYTNGQSSQPGSSGLSVKTLKSDKTKSKDTSVHSFESESDSISSSNIPYEDEESDLSVEAMIGNRSEDSDAEAVEQEFNEALDGSLEI